MTEEEANEIVDRYLYFEDISCSCHINPPCSKCVEMPSEEEYKEAVNFLTQR